MKILDSSVLPGDSVAVDADLKEGAMTFERATAKAARG
jgi:flagellar biosynthesis component FlhA